MAGLVARATFQPQATGTADITLLMLKAPTNQRLKVRSWCVSFQGTDNLGTPIQVQLLRVSTDGTGSSVTPVKMDDSIADSIQGTATESYGGTNEPTAGSILERRYIHPQTNYTEIVAEPDEVIVGAGDRIALKAIAPNASVNATGFIEWEE